MEDNAATHQHEDHSKHRMSLLTCAGIGVGLTAGALILTPYILPLAGVGDSALAVQSMASLHSAATAGSGLAGIVNNGLAAVPFIGEKLAEGGIFTAVTSGAVGLGGMLLGRYVGKHEDGKKYIKWGKVITVAALTASALIALPTALTGISAGITYLAAVHSTELASSAVTFLAKTIGAANSKSLTAAGATGATLALSHLLTCGAAAAPPLLSFGLNHIHGQSQHEKHTMAMPEQAAGATGGVNASITLAAPTAANLPVSGIVTLTDANGKPITPDDLKPIHTKKLHFFVIDSSLRDYHHIHPQPTEVPGQYAFSFTPKTGNSYSGWSDVTLQADGKNYRNKTDMPAAINRSISPSVLMNTHAEAKNAGLTFEWNADKPLTKNASSMVEVTVKDAQGKPVTDLEPVLGAYAHLVGFSADGKTLIHSHPMGAEPADANSRSGPTLRFHVQPEAAGNSQFYLQVKEHGQDVYAPFGQLIRQPEKATEQVQPRSLYPAANAPQMNFGIA